MQLLQRRYSLIAKDTYFLSLHLLDLLAGVQLFPVGPDMPVPFLSSLFHTQHYLYFMAFGSQSSHNPSLLYSYSLLTLLIFSDVFLLLYPNKIPPAVKLKFPQEIVSGTVYTSHTSYTLHPENFVGQELFSFYC